MRSLFEFHPVFGYRFVPGLKARVPHEGGGYLLRANEAGFRCRHEFQAERKDGLRRILLFGDSNTAGEGVSDGQRFGDVLEELVPNVEVYNFGLPATGPDQHYLIYRQLAAGIEHDLMMIVVFVENVRRVNSRYRYYLDDEGQKLLYAKPYYTLEDGRLTLHGVPPPKRAIGEEELPLEERRFVAALERFPLLKTWYRRLSRSRWFRRAVLESGLKDALLKAVRYQPIGEYRHDSDPAWKLLRAILFEWISKHDAKTLLVPLPFYHYVAGLSDPSAYQRRFREVAADAGAEYFDPLPQLREFSREERRSFYYLRDAHPTRAGHRALATCMAPTVSRLLNAASNN